MCHSAQAVTEAVAINILINAIAHITYLGNFGGWSALFFGVRKNLISATEKFSIPHPVNLSYHNISYPQFNMQFKVIASILLFVAQAMAQQCTLAYLVLHQDKN